MKSTPVPKELTAGGDTQRDNSNPGGPGFKGAQGEMERRMNVSRSPRSMRRGQGSTQAEDVAWTKAGKVDLLTWSSGP